MVSYLKDCFKIIKYTNKFIKFLGSRQNQDREEGLKGHH